MVLAKSKTAVGLGNSLMNDRFGKGKGGDMRRANFNQSIKRTDAQGETYLTNVKSDPAWMKMQSVTEQAALEDFLSTAQLAGTDFSAQKSNNIKVIHPEHSNPYLLSAAEEAAATSKHHARSDRLTIPRRPAWQASTTAPELDRMERQSLLDWRRRLAELQESDDLLMTPFERNPEVWRQLWRVIERSDLVVQIVDARNPLLFRSADLEKYVKEVDPRKANLLLVNKADMLSLSQRKVWADFFREKRISFRFFSAALAKKVNDARSAEEHGHTDDGAGKEDEDGRGAGEPDEGEEGGNGRTVDDDDDNKLATSSNHSFRNEEDFFEDDDGPRDSEDEDSTELTRILTTDELEQLFLRHAPAPANDKDERGAGRKTTIGMVGYPNVGKSSTINTLIGAKKVSVSATPGKTKHFQTIHLSASLLLCDCPGLVFPNFATTKADLVCNGILPIDQLREYTGPAGLLVQRLPQHFLESVYGITIKTRPIEEGGTGQPTAEELLSAHSAARGFYTQGLGQPDQSRAARHILKDYVNGKLLFCQPPPLDPPIDPVFFNQELYSAKPAKGGDGAALARQAGQTDAATDAASQLSDPPSTAPPVQGEKSARLDKRFFGPARQHAGHMTMPFQWQYSEQGQEASRKPLSGRKERIVVALEKGVDPSEVRLSSGKKHFKGNKRRTKTPSNELEV